VGVTFLSYLTVLWVAESGARLEQELSTKEAKSSNEIANEKSGLISIFKNKEHDYINENSVARRYEVIDLVSYFLGPMHRGIYQIALMALMYVALLAYAQVFCGSLGALLLSPGSATWEIIVPQVAFAIVVLPLSCMELDEQVGIQSLMALVRFLAIFIMVGGSIAALVLTEENPNSSLGLAGENGDCNIYTACFSGFGVAFSTALFSQLFQHSVPGLIRPLQSHQVLHVPKVFGTSLLTTSFFYLMLGTTAAAYFGNNTKSSVNLNFANFLFGLDENKIPGFVAFLLKMASSVVVMFPALDTLSVFPLVANTLGSNLLASCPTGLNRLIATMLLVKDENAVLLDERRLINFWRLVAAIPPLVGSLWSTDLSFSILMASVAGVYVAFIAPALLQWVSYRRQLQTLNEGVMASATTPYSGWHSQLCFVGPVLVFAFFALIIVLEKLF